MVEKTDSKVEKINADHTVDIPRNSLARPKGKIQAVNFQSSSTLMGGRPSIFKLDRRHTLEVRANVHGWAYNEYVAVNVCGNCQ